MAENKDRSSKSKKILYVSIFAIILVLFSLLSAAISLILIYKDSIHNGISIENIDISGLTVVEANNRVENNLKDILKNEKLILKCNGRTWKYTSGELALKYDFLKAVNDAYLIGRHGTYLDRIQTIVDLIREPYNISLKSSVNSEKINSLLDEIEKEIAKPNLDATIIRKNDEFIVAKEILGVKLNREKTIEKISQGLLNSGFYDVVEVDLVLEKAAPKYTYDKLSQIKDLLGSYTTKFNTNAKGRSYNVNMAAKAINGTVILPGDVFSFNNVVGPRTIENGYRIAPVIFKGELVDGVGGGVCQVSSTLYNSILMSRLGIIERTNHTIPSTYVPIGLDATVSYGVLDFKFQNTLDFPVYIESFTKGNKITISIYGKKTSNRRVKLTSQIDKVIKKDTEIVFEDTMFEGEKLVAEKGRNGYRASSYMIIYDGDKLVDKKLISKDYYRPRKEIIKKGTKKRIEIGNEKTEKQIDLDENN